MSKKNRVGNRASPETPMDALRVIYEDDACIEIIRGIRREFAGSGKKGRGKGGEYFSREKVKGWSGKDSRGTDKCIGWFILAGLIEKDMERADNKQSCLKVSSGFFYEMVRFENLEALKSHPSDDVYTFVDGSVTYYGFPRDMSRAQLDTLVLLERKLVRDIELLNIFRRRVLWERVIKAQAEFLNMIPKPGGEDQGKDLKALTGLYCAVAVRSYIRDGSGVVDGFFPEKELSKKDKLEWEGFLRKIVRAARDDGLIKYEGTLSYSREGWEQVRKAVMSAREMFIEVIKRYDIPDGLVAVVNGSAWQSIRSAYAGWDEGKPTTKGDGLEGGKYMAFKSDIGGSGARNGKKRR